MSNDKQKRRVYGEDEDEAQRPLLNERSYEAQSSDFYQSAESTAGPSNYGTVNDAEAQRFTRSRSNSMTPRDAFMRFIFRGILTSVVFIALVFGFVKFIRFEDLQQELAKVPQINITDFAIKGFSEEGIHVRVVGVSTNNFDVVGGEARRFVVKSGASVLNTLTMSNTKLKVYFEEDAGEYARAVDATMPDLKVHVGQGASTDFDFVTTLSDFGSARLMGAIAQKLIKTESLKFRGVAKLDIKKGRINFGNVPVVVEQTLNQGSQEMDLKIGDIQLNSRDNGVQVATQVTGHYPFPLKAKIPSLAWELKIPGCEHEQLFVAKGRTSDVELMPFGTVNVSVHSNVGTVPNQLVLECGAGEKSPLDQFLTKYLDGQYNNVVIQGSEAQDNLPQWIGQILSAFKFTIDLPGKDNNDDLIKDLRFDDFRLQLPNNNMARISASATVTISPPSSITIDEALPLKVLEARGLVDMFSQGSKFAHVVIHEWIPCKTTVSNGDYIVVFNLDRVPVDVTNQTVFNHVVRDVLFKGSSPVRVEALVDAQLQTPVGEFVLTQIPASGKTELRA